MLSYHTAYCTLSETSREAVLAAARVVHRAGGHVSYDPNFRARLTGTVRDIAQKDDKKIASIIRACLDEFGAAKPGTVYYDATTDHLHKVFQKERSKYFVAVDDDEIVAGAGIYPTEGLPDNTCELVKMYVSKQARGKGLASTLLRLCIDEAKDSGYAKMYLETMPELTYAISMYKKNGFTFIPHQLGNSGHCGCDLFMMKEI